MAIDERGGFRLESTVETVRNGESQVTFNAEVEVINPDAVHSYFTIIPGIARPVDAARRVEFRPQNLADLQDRVQSQADRIGGLLDIGGGGGEARATANAARTTFNLLAPINIPGFGGSGPDLSVSIPSSLQNIASMRVNELPYENSETIEFTPIPVPEMPGERFSINDLPELEYEVTLVTNADINPTVTVSVIPEVLFDTRDITEGTDCDELFPEIFSDARSLRDRVENISPTETQSIQQQEIQISSIGQTLPLGQAREQLQDTAEEIPISSCRLDLLSELSGLDVQGCSELTDFYSNIDNRINRLQTEVESVSETVNKINIQTGGGQVREEAQQTIDALQGTSIQNIRETITNLRSDGTGNIPGVDQIQQEIDEAREQASQEEIACVDQLQSKLNRVQESIPNPDTLSVPTTPQPERLDCGDIPGNLNSRANSLASDIRSRVRGGGFIRSNEAERLTSEIDTLRQQIQQRADDNNPCKTDLLFTLNEAEQNIIEAEPEGCTDIYPSIDSDVDQLESRVVQLGRGVSAAEIDQVRSDAEDVLDSIQNEIDAQDTECATRFSDRVQSVVSRIGQEVSTVRVIQAIGEEAAQERQEEIENLRGEINRINEEFQQLVAERQGQN